MPSASTHSYPRNLAPTRKVRLLVADDSPFALSSTLAYLGSLAEVVVDSVCENGRMAVEAALQREPDVALLDLQMPVMSGLEAAEIFRNSMPHVGVILTSLQDKTEVREACLAGGADAFIGKERLPSQFPAVLAAVLQAVHAPERHRRAPRFVTRPLTDLFAPARRAHARFLTPAGTPGRGFTASGFPHD